MCNYILVVVRSWYNPRLLYKLIEHILLLLHFTYLVSYKKNLNYVLHVTLLLYCLYSYSK